MRLLNLSKEVQQMIIDGKITPGHARPLLSIENEQDQIEMAQRVFDENLSVRATEKEIKALNKPKKPRKLTSEALNLIYRKLEDQMREKLGAKVNIIPKDDQKGKIEIEYYSQTELEEIVNKITGKG
jgi:ParB family chromosome partitioning protein